MSALLYPFTAAQMLGVHPRTLTRWEREGRFQSVRTVGGHRRYRLEDVQAVLDGKKEMPR